MLPLVPVRDRFRVDVSGHFSRLRVDQLDVMPIRDNTDLLMQPSNRDAMDPAQMPHTWVTAGADNLYRSLVVLVEDRSVEPFREKSAPEVKCRQQHVFDREMPTDKLSLRSGTRNAPLAFGDTRNRKVRVIPLYGQMHARC